MCVSELVFHPRNKCRLVTHIGSNVTKVVFACVCGTVSMVTERIQLSLPLVSAHAVLQGGSRCCRLAGVATSAGNVFIESVAFFSSDNSLFVCDLSYLNSEFVTRVFVNENSEIIQVRSEYYNFV